MPKSSHTSMAILTSSMTSRHITSTK